MCLITAYAPCGTYDFASRRSFFDALSDFLKCAKCHGPRVLLGDFNARMHYQRAGENTVIRPYIFGNPDAADDPQSNRSMLFELCTEFSSVLANTWFEPGADGVVTYRNLGVSVAAEASRYQDFAQLDFIIVPRCAVDIVHNTFVDRTAGLRSQHFLLVGVFEVHIEKKGCPNRTRMDFSAFDDAEMRVAFRDEAFEALTGQPLSGESVVIVLHAAAKAVLHTPLKAAPRRPWISSKTLRLIDRRNELRMSGNHVEEGVLQKEIRSSVRVDRRAWLDELASAGAWTQVKMLRRGLQNMKGRLRNLEGATVTNDEKPEMFVEYFEEVQWRVRPLEDVLDQELLGPSLNVNLDRIILEELHAASKYLKL